MMHFIPEKTHWIRTAAEAWAGAGAGAGAGRNGSEKLAFEGLPGARQNVFSTPPDNLT